MEKLSISPPNVPLQNSRIVMMKKIITINIIKSEELEIIRNSTRKRKTFFPKKIVVLLTRVKMTRQSFYLWA